jgi:hypothetical protein
MRRYRLPSAPCLFGAAMGLVQDNSILLIHLHGLAFVIDFVTEVEDQAERKAT